MVYTFSSDDPIEKVLATVEEVYGVKVKVIDPDEAADDEQSKGGPAPDGLRTKQDST